VSEGFFKRLKLALLKNPVPEPMPVPDKPQRVLPLEDMLADLIKIPYSIWGEYAFSREILRSKINEQEKKRLIEEAYECGYSYADKLAEKYGTRVPVIMAEALGLEISYPDIPTDTSRVTFAEFIEPNKVMLYQDNLDKANEVFKEEKVKQMIEISDVQQLLIAHEIFHYIEVKDAEKIFTQTEKLELWAPKPFRNRSTIRCLGEIAGMAFAQRLIGLNYSPFVMDVFFVYGYSKEVATILYDEIMELVNENLKEIK
jgi:hypothetical protein